MAEGSLAVMNVVTGKRSALAAFSDQKLPAGDAIGLEVIEYPFQGYHNLRCDPSVDGVDTILTQALGTALPSVPNRVAQGNGVVVYWLGPDEWLLRMPAEDDTVLVDEIRERLDTRWFALTDLSGGMTHLHLAGASVNDVLSQGTTLDLHPGVFTLGQCAQTVLARTNVLIAPAQGGCDLFVRRSFAHHVFLFLRDAAHDYGFDFSRPGA